MYVMVWLACVGWEDMRVQAMQLRDAQMPCKAYLCARPLWPKDNVRIHRQIPRVANAQKICTEARATSGQRRADGLQHDVHRWFCEPPFWPSRVMPTRAEERLHGALPKRDHIQRRFLGQVQNDGGEEEDATSNTPRRRQVCRRHDVFCRLRQPRTATTEQCHQARLHPRFVWRQIWWRHNIPRWLPDMEDAQEIYACETRHTRVGSQISRALDVPGWLPRPKDSWAVPGPLTA